VVEYAENRGWRRLLGSRAPSSSLTAAGSPFVVPVPTAGSPVRSNPPVSSGLDPATPDGVRARALNWQKRALEYRDAIPELAGAAALVRGTMNNVRWVVEGGNADIRDRIQARIDQLDRDRLIELIWLSGEGYIAAPEDPGVEVPIEQVEAPYTLSVDEINLTDPLRPTVKGPNNEFVDLVEQGSDKPVPYMRIWKPANTNRWQATSPVKAAMDLLEAMYLSQLADTATQRSRLAGAGIMFWPTNAPNIPVEAGEKPDPTSRQAMLQAFEDAAWSSIGAQNSREAIIPFVVMYDPAGDADYKPEMFRIERDDLAAQYQIRSDVYASRLAQTLELPIESQTGMGSTNHWSAWQIDTDKWRTWLKPLDDLARKQVELRLVKPYGSQYRLVADATELVKKPDMTDVIIKLMQLEQVTPESGVAALETGLLTDLVPQEPPASGPSLGRAPGQPSDFGRGDTNRGGGRFREQA
jgi:hypothetical protein